VANFRVVEDALSAVAEELETCLTELVHKIRYEIQEMDGHKSIKNRSESLKGALTENVKTVNWQKKSLFESPDLANAPAIFRLDGTAQCDERCGSYHQINVVTCLNNREVIGTNFLKLEVSAIESIRNHPAFPIYDSNILGLLITLDENVLQLGGWDKAYANSSEYSFAYKHAYKSLIKSNVLSLQIHLI
jgi:hypothetical protein